MLTVVLPSYNEEENVPLAAKTIGQLLREEDIPYELLFVDDGSKDGTWEQIKKAAKADPHVHGLSFSRNFGKESAIFAGLQESHGDCTAVMDCDLQHPPAKLVEMYRLWEQGYEVIEGVKSDRGKESGAHRFAARSFYKIISQATGMDMENASDFKLLDRKAVEVLIHMPEKEAFFRALSSWIGFKTASVEYEVQERQAGVSKWSTKALISYALVNITSFTALPMQIVTVLGIITLLVSIVFSVISFVQKIMGVALGGFTTVILLIGFIGSIIMISLGIIGYYLARIYEEVKGRPRFILSEKI